MNELSTKASLSPTDAAKYPDFDIFMRDNNLTEFDVLDEFLNLHEQAIDFSSIMTIEEVGEPWDGFVVPERVMSRFPTYATPIQSVYSIVFHADGLVPKVENGFNSMGVHLYISSDQAQSVVTEIAEEVEEEMLDYEKGKRPLQNFFGDPDDMEEVRGHLYDEKMGDRYQLIADSQSNYYGQRGVEFRSGEMFNEDGSKREDYVSMIDDKSLHTDAMILAQWFDYASKRLRIVMYDPFGKMGVVPQREVW